MSRDQFFKKIGWGRINFYEFLFYYNPIYSRLKITKVTESEVVISGEEPKEEKFQKAKQVRKFFPETMYWQAELIAENGTASLNIPMKDSITRWHLSALANSLSGKVGSQDENVIVFQDFFIDFDIPYNLKVMNFGFLLPCIII